MLLVLRFKKRSKTFNGSLQSLQRCFLTSKHCRLALQQFIRKAGKKPSKQDQLDIAQRRVRLSTRITAHQTRARYLLHLTVDEEDDRTFSYFDSSWIDHEDGAENAGAAETFLDITGHDEPEKFRLALPSTLGQDACKRRNLDHAVQAEIQLRIGQCNDMLQAIRLAIAKKSVLYKAHVRPAVNTEGKTRAYHKVQAADATLRYQAQIYRQLRVALIALKASQDVLQRFRELLATDLKTTSTLLHWHPSIEGMKHKHLPWFWLLDVAGDTSDMNMMTECTNYFSALPELILLTNLVYRVNWLRANEGFQRCQEEVVLVHSEMDWTVRYFSYQAKRWSERTASKDNSLGHRLFGLRMAALWDRLAQRSRDSFRQLRTQNPAPANVQSLLRQEPL